MHRKFLSPAALGAACLLASSAALSAGYPEHTIRVIVATGPGTSTDLLARAITPEMGRTLGQALIVENKAGADQVIGAEFVARGAPADGYTVGAMGLEGLALLPITVKDLRFDPLKDLPAVIGLAEGRYLLGSPASAPWKNFAEMVSMVRANPGKYTYGSSAPQVRFPVLIVMQLQKLDMVHIPYNGGAKYLQGMLAGEYNLGITGEASLVTMGDKARALAVTGATRRPNFPDVPTFAELGYPQTRGASYTLNVRAGTPKEVTDRLYSSTLGALQNAEVKATLAKIMLEPQPDSAEVEAKRLVDVSKSFTDLAKLADIKPQ